MMVKKSAMLHKHSRILYYIIINISGEIRQNLNALKARNLINNNERVTPVTEILISCTFLRLE